MKHSTTKSFMFEPSKLIVYTLPHSASEYKPLPRQTLKLSFGEKQAKCPPKPRKVILFDDSGGFRHAKKLVRVTDELFCTRSGIPPVRHMDHDCEGEQPEEENLCPISQKTRRKRFHTQQGLCPCCNHIVTLLKPFCNRVL